MKQEIKDDRRKENEKGVSLKRDRLLKNLLIDIIVINIIRNNLMNTKIAFLSNYSLHKNRVNTGILRKN